MRGKTLKQLAKCNQKLDLWIKHHGTDNNTVVEVPMDITEEIDAPEQENEIDLERKKRANEMKEYWEIRRLARNNTKGSHH